MMNKTTTAIVMAIIGLLTWSFVDDKNANRSKTDLNDYAPKSEGELVVHSNYQLAYSEENEGALWVFYHLTKDQMSGDAQRKNNFKVDPKVSTGSATLNDYKGSGYDRGHLCPAASMSFSQKAMDESFYMSNMSPQAPSLNRGRWKSLEGQVRKWVIDMGELYVVSGAIYNESLGTIGQSKVTVPRYYYKVIWDSNDQMIGFILPNEKCPDSIESYVVPVDSIESLTGIDFFYSLPNGIEHPAESNPKKEYWF